MIMLFNKIFPRSKCGLVLTTTVSCWTLVFFLFALASSLENDIWLNTFHNDDNQPSSIDTESNLDVTRPDSLNAEYPSNLHRIKRSPLLSWLLEDFLEEDDTTSFPDQKEPKRTNNADSKGASRAVDSDRVYLDRKKKNKKIKKKPESSKNKNHQIKKVVTIEKKKDSVGIKETPKKNNTIVNDTPMKNNEDKRKKEVKKKKTEVSTTKKPTSMNVPEPLKSADKFPIITNSTSKPQSINSKTITVLPVIRLSNTSAKPLISADSKKLSTTSQSLKVTNYLGTLPIQPVPSKSTIKNSTLSSSIVKITSNGPNAAANTTRINSTVLTNDPIVIKPNSIFYDARDITYFLESHAAHSIHDPRAYFTEERISRAMKIILRELPKMPDNLRFAYIIRTLNELGRKIASKLNYLTVEIGAILRRTPDDLGNKPDVSMIINTVKNVFESKEDQDPQDESNIYLQEKKPIKKLIGNDQEKAIIFGQAGITIAGKMGRHLANYLFQALGPRLNNMTDTRRSAAAILFCDSLKKGVGEMILQMDKSDKFRVYEDMKEIFKEVIDQVEIVLKDIFKRIKNLQDIPKEEDMDPTPGYGAGSFADLNPISPKTSLIGPYNTNLFTNLGSAERVIKLLGSLVSRVPPEAKARWINIHASRFDKEYKQTLSGFVTMQGMSPFKGNSEDVLLDLKKSSLIITPKLPVARDDYDLQKNKIPARCYLAGRRSRLYLTRGLKDFENSEKIITQIANRLSKWKTMLVYQSGNEIYRMCLPRVEVGLRSWGINGDPQSDGSATSKFQFRNPLESLNTMKDPFENGVQLGYRIGAKIGYNEERNATLELESSGGSGNLTAKSDLLSSRFIGRAAYRKATTAAAQKAFEIAVREGYLTALKVSIRAGLKMPAEAGSKMAALKSVGVATMIGMETGGSFADKFLINKELEAKQKDFYIKLGKDQGYLAGMRIGEKIGSFVGKQAAEEAYKRAITRGGKLERAKFHLEEFEAGAHIGFQYGLKVGKRVATSPNMDPSAPKMLLIPEPLFSNKRRSEDSVDHWEKDLIPPLSEIILDNLKKTRKHILVEGNLTGSYTVTKETKSLWMLTHNTTKTYQLTVNAKGYVKGDIAYLNLIGTVDNLGTLQGSIMTKATLKERLKE